MFIYNYAYGLHVIFVSVLQINLKANSIVTTDVFIKSFSTE